MRDSERAYEIVQKLKEICREAQSPEEAVEKAAELGCDRELLEQLSSYRARFHAQ
jgi:hypothetical protein